MVQFFDPYVEDGLDKALGIQRYNTECISLLLCLCVPVVVCLCVPVVVCLCVSVVVCVFNFAFKIRKPQGTAFLIGYYQFTLLAKCRNQAYELLFSVHHFWGCFFEFANTYLLLSRFN